MGYPTKVQLIKRKNSRQFYINLPSAVAHAMEFKQSEVVEWIIEDKSQLVLRRSVTPPSTRKIRQKGFSNRFDRPDQERRQIVFPAPARNAGHKRTQTKLWRAPAHARRTAQSRLWRDMAESHRFCRRKTPLLQDKNHRARAMENCRRES